MSLFEAADTSRAHTAVARQRGCGRSTLWDSEAAAISPAGPPTIRGRAHVITCVRPTLLPGL